MIKILRAFKEVVQKFRIQEIFYALIIFVYISIYLYKNYECVEREKFWFWHIFFLFLTIEVTKKNYFRIGIRLVYDRTIILCFFFKYLTRFWIDLYFLNNTKNRNLSLPESERGCHGRARARRAARLAPSPTSLHHTTASCRTKQTTALLF